MNVVRWLARSMATLVLLWPTRSSAHPIHTTFAEVQVHGAQATVTIRAFADDFAAAVARFNGRPLPRDSAAPPEDVARYLRERLQVRDARGAAVALVPCGVRRASALTYVCVQLAWSAGLQVTNMVLRDLHPDQVNIMQATGGRTWLFTPSASRQVLQ